MASIFLQGTITPVKNLSAMINPTKSISGEINIIPSSTEPAVEKLSGCSVLVCQGVTAFGGISTTLEEGDV